MGLMKKQKTTADDVRRVALAALVSALEDGKEDAKKKPGLTGLRAVTTGAVLYTAGRAIYGGRRFVQERLGSDGDEAETRSEDEDDLYDEPEAEADQDEEEYEDEPEAEADQDEEEYEDEPEAEADQDEDEPEAEADQDEDDEPEAKAKKPRPANRLQRKPRRPARPGGSAADQPSLDLPSRPKRSRAPART